MSRVSTRAGTKTKVIKGKGGQKPPKYKYSQGSKYHPRDNN